MSQISFREEQQFRQWWLWLLVGPLTLLPVAVFGYAIFTQLVLGIPWTDDPMPDLVLLLLGTFLVVLMIAVAGTLFFLRMVTEVRPDAVAIKVRPFVNRLVPYSQIQEVQWRKYSPILEYGGWGIRWRPGKGMAFNVSGNQGVELSLSNGRTLMIGTQRPQELEAAIKEAMALAS